MDSFQTVILALGMFPPMVHLCDLHSMMIFGSCEPRSNLRAFGALPDCPTRIEKSCISTIPCCFQYEAITLSKSAPTCELLTAPIRWKFATGFIVTSLLV